MTCTCSLSDPNYTNPTCPTHRAHRESHIHDKHYHPDCPTCRVEYLNSLVPLTAVILKVLTEYGASSRLPRPMLAAGIAIAIDEWADGADA